MSAGQENAILLRHGKLRLSLLSTLTGVAPTVALTTLAAVMSNMAANSGKESAALAEKASRAIQNAQDVHDNSAIAFHSAKSLDDVVEKLASLVVFWHCHTQDLENKIQKLQTLKDQSVRKGKLNPLEGKVVSEVWTNLAVEMRDCRPVVIRGGPITAKSNKHQSSEVSTPFIEILGELLFRTVCS